MGRVLVTRRLPRGGTDPLVADGHEIQGGIGDDAWEPEALADALRGGVDALVCLLADRVDESLLEVGAEGGLRVVANVAVGYDNIDVAAAVARGIVVCNTPGVLDESTADLAFLLILAASRLASEAEADLRAGSWPGWGINQYLGHDVHGAVLGVVGYGRIGRAVARRARGFGMEVLHHSRHATGEPGYVAELDELLQRSDVVSLHVPLTDETRHLVGSRQLELMGPRAVLVNTARGPVVDEVALARALHTGTIFAAGLDVYECEPQVHPLLLDAPRTVLLPHIGSATAATRTAMARLACRQVCDVLAGRPPPHPVGAGPR